MSYLLFCASRWLHVTCAEVDEDTYNRVEDDDELIFVCESCNQEEMSSSTSQVHCVDYNFHQLTCNGSRILP